MTLVPWVWNLLELPSLSQTAITVAAVMAVQATSADDIANRLRDHLRAGANHVVIQVLGGPDKLLPTLAELAGPLGIKARAA